MNDWLFLPMCILFFLLLMQCNALPPASIHTGSSNDDGILETDTSETVFPRPPSSNPTYHVGPSICLTRLPLVLSSSPPYFNPPGRKAIVRFLPLSYPPFRSLHRVKRSEREGSYGCRRKRDRQLVSRNGVEIGTGRKGGGCLGDEDGSRKTVVGQDYMRR